MIDPRSATQSGGFLLQGISLCNDIEAKGLRSKEMANMSQEVSFAILNALALKGMTLDDAEGLVGPPIPGRAGWIERYAERASLEMYRAKQDAANRAAAERVRAAEAALAARREEDAAIAARRDSAEDAIAAKSGGYVLRDTNQYFYNCGHYPHYIVLGAMRPEDVQYTSRAAAEDVMRRKNAASSAAWAAYLNG
jgi:hypothetical protein